MTPLTLTMRTVGDIAVVKLVGKLHCDDSVDVEVFVITNVFGQQFQKVVFNMTDVETIGSEWLGALISIHTRLQEFDQKLHLVNPRESLVKMLVRTKLDDVFAIHHGVTTDAQIEELFL